MSSHKPNNTLYHGVINEVIDSVRDSFLDEGIDEAVLADLKAMWKKKLEESKALEERKSQNQDQVMYLYMPKNSSEHHVPPNNQHRDYNYQRGYRPTPPQMQATRPTQRHEYPVIHSMPPSSINYPPHAARHPFPTPQPPVTSHQQHLHQNRLIQPRRQMHHDIRHRPHHHVPPIMHPRRLLPPNQPSVPHIQPTSVIQPNFQHRQHDGAGDDSSSSDSSVSDSDDETAKKAPTSQSQEQEQSEESLNSGDDIGSNGDGAETFETENVVVCQFDKIQRVRNKWRFQLKDGIMSLNGKDFVFQKATGDCEW